MNLYAWQAAELTHTEPKRLIMAHPRLGKSLVGIHWLEQVNAHVSIVVAPLVVCSQWKELLQARDGVLVLDLYSKYPAAITALLGTIAARETASIVIIVNYDKLKGLYDQLIKLKPGALILDESHYIKSPSSSRGRIARRLSHAIPYVRLLTGTVAPNGPGDLWGQFACINRDLWGSSFTAFSRKHLIVDAMMYNRVIGVRDPKRLQEMIDQCSGSYRREDVFGADQWQTVVRTIDLDLKTRKTYDTIVKDWVLEQERDGFDLTMTHTLSRMKRLQQLTSGYLPDENGDGKLVHTGKIDTVMEDLEEILLAGEKAVLFHQFTWEGDEYVNRLESLGARVFQISGAVSGEQRAERIRDFERTSTRAVFVVQTAAGGIGISLASATHALFTSQSFSFDVEQQARDRIFSPGKSRCVTYYTCRRTIDQYISAILTSKSNFNVALSKSSISDICFGEVDLPTFRGF